tara:strand:- start:69 stop:488 length:420 start_codon:yes stop_codon:yes gene_type:complete
MRIQAQTARRARVDMIPLMDSMFLLLVFFIYAMMSMVFHQGLPLKLPQAASAVMNQEAFVSISINEMGEYFWNKSAVSQESLNTRLSELAKDTTAPRLFISAAAQTQHQAVIQLLDQIRLHGISKVSFETQSKSTEVSP